MEHDPDPVIAVSLDAEKVYDHVDRAHLFEIFCRMNIGPNFVNLVKSLYHRPVVQILTNSNDLS